MSGEKRRGEYLKRNKKGRRKLNHVGLACKA